MVAQRAFLASKEPFIHAFFVEKVVTSATHYSYFFFKLILIPADRAGIVSLMIHFI